MGRRLACFIMWKKEKILLIPVIIYAQMFFCMGDILAQNQCRILQEKKFIVYIVSDATVKLAMAEFRIL